MKLKRSERHALRTAIAVCESIMESPDSDDAYEYARNAIHWLSHIVPSEIPESIHKALAGGPGEPPNG